MTLRHLTIFLTVAQQGSMSGAARALYLSQPTVSQAIGELEKHYNGLLFERLGKSCISPTVESFCFLMQNSWYSNFDRWRN